MTALNKQALREAAIHAQSNDDWGCDADNFHDKATPDAVLSLLDELEAADKRIAELEAKLANPVLLPKTNGYWTDTEKAYEEAITIAKRQVRLAGFSVEDM
ncbi:ead/Ea22-like family protein [Salmonella enterica subsp. enterica serovar Kentucky]|nr:ead/Ea22-like family protein [Salmonella enterica subsp. enterica serovar Kentucky]